MKELENCICDLTQAIGKAITSPKPYPWERLEEVSALFLEAVAPFREGNDLINDLVESIGCDGLTELREMQVALSELAESLGLRDCYYGSTWLAVANARAATAKAPNAT